MTINEISKMVETSKDYDFLKQDPLYDVIKRRYRKD